MMQGFRPSSLTKKLAKVNMPNTLSRFGNGRNVKKICVGNGQLLGYPKARGGRQDRHSGYVLKDHALEL